MLAIAQGANERNDVEPELVMGQSPAAFGLGPVRFVIARALGVMAADDGQGEAANVVQGRDGALVLVDDP